MFNSDNRSKSGGAFARLIKRNTGSEIDTFLSVRQEGFFELFIEFLEIYYPKFLEIEDLDRPPTTLITRFSRWIFDEYGVNKYSQVIKDNLIDFVTNKTNEWLNK